MEILLDTPEIPRCFEAEVGRNLWDLGYTVVKYKTHREETTAISYCSQNNLFYFTDDELLFCPYNSTADVTVQY